MGLAVPPFRIPVNHPVEGEVYLEKIKCMLPVLKPVHSVLNGCVFEKLGSPVHELIQKVPHIAFEVDDLDEELKRVDFHMITEPNSPSEGVRIAMIEHNGAPVEVDGIPEKIRKIWQRNCY